MSAGSTLVLAPRRAVGVGAFATASALKGVYAIVTAPEYLFLAALTAMLFRPPDLQALPLDRISFLLLLAVVALRLALWRERVRFYAASWPMLALLSLGLWGVLNQPYDVKAWSVLAAKWIVPVAMFHVAGMVFSDAGALRKLEWFSIAVLLYLSLTAVCYLLDVRQFIFPRFILDEGIGLHAERARGPFLQAVANGVCLNILGIFALHMWERRRLHGILATALFAATPLALLATKTRAVWLAAGLSIAVVVLFARGRRSRMVGATIALLAGASLGIALLLQNGDGDLTERLQDRSPVEFRLDMYQAGWQMFMERPLLGWGSEANIQPEVAKRISSFHPEYYIFHNTYLELGVEHGLLGLGLYAWLVISLLRLGNTTPARDREDATFLGQGFGLTWLIVLGIYLLNASVVVMNYQFLNGYVFAIAGILAVQQRQQTVTGGGNEHCLPV